MRAPFSTALLALLCSGCVVFEEPAAPRDAGRDAPRLSSFDAGSDAFVLDAAEIDARGPDDAWLGADAGRDAAVVHVDGGSIDSGIVRRPTLTACGFAPPVTSGGVTEPALDEVSGMVASRRHPRVLWVIEDSGSAAVVHAINDEGAFLATYRVAGSAIDYEDLAIGPGPDPTVDYLYVADIGDNDGSRDSIVVYRAPEPVVEWDQVHVTGSLDRVEPLPMTYPDGYRDNAEALFVDPATEDIYLMTKNGFTRPNGLFRLAAPHTAAVARMLEPLGGLFAGDASDIAITAADISADGLTIVTRGLRAVNLWRRTAGVSIADTMLTTLPCAGPVAVELKGESIALSPAGYFTISEGAAPPISFVRFR